MGDLETTSHKPTIFWGEIAPCEHVAQFYENDADLLDTLTEFIGGALRADEGAIVIATEQHIGALDQRLNSVGVNVEMCRLTEQYITIRADEALARFMVRQWPGDLLFSQLVMELIKRASAGGRRVRAFGEMVALLWASGNIPATIRLEYLWNNMRKILDFSLLCAYPKTGFMEKPSQSIAEICSAHARVI
jgi:hypothetical protein